MSTVLEIEEAASKLPLAELSQLLEDLQDLATARAALLEIESGDPPVPWPKLMHELDALHD
jgi:hypothetical protein